jgi:hypothetical protein
LVKETATPVAEPFDLSTSTKESDDSKQEAVVKTEENDEGSQDKLMIVEQAHRPRGRPPISLVFDDTFNNVSGIT